MARLRGNHQSNLASLSSRGLVLFVPSVWLIPGLSVILSAGRCGDMICCRSVFQSKVVSFLLA